MDCPYDGCLAQHACFVAQTSYKTINPITKYSIHWVMFSCPVCFKCVMVNFYTSQNYDIEKIPGDLANFPSIIAKNIYPKPRSIDAPAFVNDNVGRTYSRANAAINRGEAETAAMLLRKTLDSVITDKYPNTGSGMLGQKLNNLRPEIDLPKSMVDWAKEVKDFGNIATHESQEPNIEEIKSLRDFTELFLLYTYT